MKKAKPIPQTRFSRSWVSTQPIFYTIFWRMSIELFGSI